MSPFSLVSLFCLVCLSTGIFGNPIFGDNNDGGFLQGLMSNTDTPILKALLMKKVLGLGDTADEADVPAPLARALSGDAPYPVLRAMMARSIMQNQEPNMLTKLMLLRVLANKFSTKLVDNIKARKDNNTVYTFTTPLICNCAMEYVDDNGDMAGFSVDLVYEVCKEAGKKCEMQYEPTQKCLSHDGEHFLLGEGLAGKQYDGCLGWFKAKRRDNVVAFTESYWVIENSNHLYVPAGNPKEFDPTDIAGKTIGFVNGWTGGQPCLANVTGADSMTAEYVGDRRALLNSIKREEIDAIFLQDGYATSAAEKGLERIGDSFTCAAPGETHIITRKDNRLPWFSETLKEMKENGKYYGLCAKAKTDHGHKGEINCV